MRPAAGVDGGAGACRREPSSRGVFEGRSPAKIPAGIFPKTPRASAEFFLVVKKNYIVKNGYVEK